MKYAWALLVLTVVIAAPASEKRFLLDNFVNTDELKTLVTTLVHQAGTEENEHLCESRCHDLVKANHLLQEACPLTCRSLQSLAHRFDVVPTTTVTPAPTA